MHDNSVIEEVKTNIAEYSVSELSFLLKKTVEENFSYVRIRGEISGAKLAPSGHLYFSLKDQNAVIAAICWKNTVMKLPMKPEEGLEVICTGSVTTYPGQSKYQIIVEKMEHAGVGALMALLAKRKEQFEKEGLFALERKKKLPFMPEIIGVVTSPTGAVIKDILHRVRDRMPVRVIIWPVLVQGEMAAGQISAAIDGFNQLTEHRPDVIIVARGGGSIEDLWAFNEENVVRSAANSAIPLISAVGHETDFTLIDFVSDVRAPTPTAAAEMAVPVRAELLMKLSNINSRLNSDLAKLLQNCRLRLASVSRGLPTYSAIMGNWVQRLDDLNIRMMFAIKRMAEHKSTRLERINLRAVTMRILEQSNYKYQIISAKLQPKYIMATLKQAEQKLGYLAGLLNSYSYHRTLERGFVLVRDEQNQPITSVKKLPARGKITLEFKDGSQEIGG